MVFIFCIFSFPYYRYFWNFFFLKKKTKKHLKTLHFSPVIYRHFFFDRFNLTHSFLFDIQTDGNGSLKCLYFSVSRCVTMWIFFLNSLLKTIQNLSSGDIYILKGYFSFLFYFHIKLDFTFVCYFSFKD